MPILRSAFIALLTIVHCVVSASTPRWAPASTRASSPACSPTTLCVSPKPSTARASPSLSTRWAKASPQSPPRRIAPPMSITLARLHRRPRHLDANISVKLTQMGLEQSPELAESIAENLVSTPALRRTSCASTWKTRASRRSRSTSCAASMRACGLRGAVGVVIQAYLYRSQADVEQLLADGIRVRLCKGAYKEPPEVAFPRKADVDANFLKLAKMLSTAPSTTAGHARRGSSWQNQGLRGRTGIDRPEPLRISDVVWSAPRSAAQFGARGIQGARLCSFWNASGIPTSCAAWRNARPTCSSSKLLSWRRNFFRVLRLRRISSHRAPPGIVAEQRINLLASRRCTGCVAFIASASSADSTSTIR
jgi:proline dehydrogenase